MSLSQPPIWSFTTSHSGKVEVWQESSRVYMVRPFGMLGTCGWTANRPWQIARVIARSPRAAADKARPWGDAPAE